MLTVGVGVLGCLRSRQDERMPATMPRSTDWDRLAGTGACFCIVSAMDTLARQQTSNFYTMTGDSSRALLWLAKSVLCWTEKLRPRNP